MELIFSLVHRQANVSSFKSLRKLSLSTAAVWKKVSSSNKIHGEITLFGERSRIFNAFTQKKMLFGHGERLQKAQIQIIFPGVQSVSSAYISPIDILSHRIDQPGYSSISIYWPTISPKIIFFLWRKCCSISQLKQTANWSTYTDLTILLLLILC